MIRNGVSIYDDIEDEFKLLREAAWTNNNVERIILENTEINKKTGRRHSKFYHLSQRKEDNDGAKIFPQNGVLNYSDKWAGQIFTAAWGRIGASPQKKTYTDSTHMHQQMVTKLEKGYKVKSFKTFGDHSSAYEEFMKGMGSEWDLFDEDELD